MAGAACGAGNVNPSGEHESGLFLFHLQNVRLHKLTMDCT